MSETMCQACNGRGYVASVDLMKAKTTRKPCEKCGGAGKIKTRLKDGVRCGQIEGITFVWQHLVEYEPVSTLEVRIRQSKINGVPQFRQMNPLFKRKTPVLYCEIVRMNTLPKHRGKGFMGQLFEVAKQDPRIAWIETNWKDSSPKGKAFLLKRGFVKEGNKLIWERQDGNDNGSGIKQPKTGTNQSGHGEGLGASVLDTDPKREAGIIDGSKGPATT